MFCSVKRDKKNQNYKFYLCSRYRDKETGRIKCSDKYIITLQRINYQLYQMMTLSRK